MNRRSGTGLANTARSPIGVVDVILSRIKVKSIGRCSKKGATVEKATMKSSWETERLRCVLGVAKDDRAVLTITVRDGHISRASRVLTGSIWQDDGSWK